jgi:AcrR family transcriptional regulator
VGSSAKGNEGVKPPRQRAEQVRSVATRAALLATARKLFGAEGYHATGTSEVVSRSGVTRGALYHHFTSKEGLFEAVYREVARDLGAEAQDATRALSGQTWARMLASIRAYLAIVAARPDIQRILLIDGPAVIGWRRWRELQTEFRLAEWQETLRLLSEQGVIGDHPPEPLAHLLLALMDDAALSVAHAKQPEAALADVTAAVELLLGGLRAGRT